MKISVNRSVQVYKKGEAIRVLRPNRVEEAKRKAGGFELKEDKGWISEYAVKVLEEDKSIIERIKSWIIRR